MEQEQEKKEVKKSAYDVDTQILSYLKDDINLRNANITINSPIVKQLKYAMIKHQLNPITKDVYIVPFAGDAQLIISYNKLMELGAKSVPRYAGYSITKGVSKDLVVSQYNGTVFKRNLPEYLEVDIYQWLPNGNDRISISTTTVYWDDAKGSSPIWKSKPYYMYEKTALANAFRKVPYLDLAGMMIQEELDSIKPEQIKEKPKRIEVEVEMKGGE